MNGAPLFTGDAGSGESEIRRWVLENDWLEAIIALPEQIFYNTGIATYVWILSNRKPEARQGRVQLIDATALWTPMRRSLGSKRRFLSDRQVAEVVRLYEDLGPPATNGPASGGCTEDGRSEDSADGPSEKGQADESQKPARVKVFDTVVVITDRTVLGEQVAQVISLPSTRWRRITSRT